MRHIFLLGMTIISLSTYAQTILADPEILFYKFDRSDNHVINYASNPPVGTDTAMVMGSLRQDSTSGCSGAIVGTGISSSSDYINTKWPTNLTGISWTISFVTSNILSSSAVNYIFGDYYASSFRCFTNGVAGPNNWILRAENMNDVYINNGAVAGRTRTTFVYDMAQNTIFGYLDSVLVTSVAQSNLTLDFIDFFKVAGFFTNVGLPADGLLEEFRLYSRALSHADVESLASNITYKTQNIATCNSSYTSPSGNKVWNTTGTYQDTISISPQCGKDVYTIHLSMNQATTANINISKCEPYLYTSSNKTMLLESTDVYRDTLVNTMGCDSFVVINFTLEAIDITTSVNNTTITSAESNVISYKWVNCDTQDTIVGANGSSYEATENGNYAVVITNTICTKTSACVAIQHIGLLENEANKIKVFPNSATNYLTIEQNNSLSIVNIKLHHVNGQLLYEKETAEPQTNIDIQHLPAGVYILHILHSERTDVIKVIKN